MEAGTIINDKFAQLDTGKRVLLLSHCLRPSQTCPGKFAKTGLVCPQDCTENCVVGRASEVAIRSGYKGVCIAAGGAMALKFVKEYNPQAIVAVACDKELCEGVEGVGQIFKNAPDTPIIMVVPLLKDGCVDTEVDEKRLMEAIVMGTPDAVLKE